MGVPKDPNISSDRQKWDNIFNAAVLMLQTQQTQMEAFLKERKFLENRIKLQYDQIGQMKRAFTVQKKLQLVESAKLDLLMSMKQREAFLSKLKSEDLSTELEDFKAWFDHLSRKVSDSNDILDNINIKDEGRRIKALEIEVRRLKSENEKLVASNISEVSALLAEKNFVWNQYNTMEKEKSNQLKSKCDELESANEKVRNLLTEMERLQPSIKEKDDAIATLTNHVAKLRAELVTKSEQISRLSRELEVLKKSASDSATPLLRRCTAERTSRLGSKNSSAGDRNVVVKKESYPSRVSDPASDTEKGHRSSKRVATSRTPVLETPKLFTSSFKVPKLKNSSPHIT